MNHDGHEYGTALAPYDVDCDVCGVEQYTGAEVYYSYLACSYICRYCGLDIQRDERGTR